MMYWLLTHVREHVHLLLLLLLLLLCGSISSGSSIAEDEPGAGLIQSHLRVGRRCAWKKKQSINQKATIKNISQCPHNPTTWNQTRGHFHAFYQGYCSPFPVIFWHKTLAWWCNMLNKHPKQYNKKEASPLNSFHIIARDSEKTGTQSTLFCTSVHHDRSDSLLYHFQVNRPRCSYSPVGCAGVWKLASHPPRKQTTVWHGSRHGAIVGATLCLGYPIKGGVLRTEKNCEMVAYFWCNF